MIIDGGALAARLYAELKNEVSHMKQVPHLTVFTCAPNFETQKYLRLKKRKAQEVGVGVSIVELPDSLTTEEMVQSVTHACLQTDGIIVQLPLPAHIDTDKVLEAIPAQYDVDGMHYEGTANSIVSPVVAAIALIAEQNDILLAAQQVVVVGQGRLVGKPAALWAKGQGACVSVLTKESEDVMSKIATADILILGAGDAHMVLPEMVKDGVVIFDAATSEDGGELVGDAHPDCAQKASLMTPVPGGIGPITVAMLLKNLIERVSH